MSLSWVAGAAGAAAQWAKENPRTTAAVASGSLVCVAPGLLVAPVLGILGFTGNGVAAVSIASGIQAGIGNVAAGSAFAVLQSAAAGGAGGAIVGGVVSGAGVAVAAGGAVGNAIKNRR